MQSDTGTSSFEKSGKTLIDRLTSLFHNEEADERGTVRETLREARRRNVFDDDTLSMMEGALGVSEIRAGDLMVPRAKLDAVDFSEPREVWLPKLIASGHSRFPAVEDDLDNVLGILHAKDLLQLLVKPDADPKSFIRPARFIPESQPVNVLLRDFRATRSHLALVIDEYGSVSGLITIEDVIEQIVGDISDEFDRDEDSLNIVPDGPGRWRVRTVTTIQQFNDYFGSDLEDDFCETIGGLVTDRFEHVPHAGESIVERGFRFRILLGDDRKARLLGVEKADAQT
ncbi:MAG: transporter associated domain-containing protein [Sutterella sp.]|nr:transporter associated domain-containing protein [Sutterella sp.]